MTQTTASPFIIGIDLGTTNSAVSYLDLRDRSPEASGIRTFKIPQLTGPGELSRLPVLPSFLYIPGPYDISATSVTHPWQKPDDHFAGAFARDQGGRVPARLVSSAKSWLCHAGADRRGRILPWGAGDGIARVSPVQATAAYLQHIRKAWNSTWDEDDELYLENQLVIVTVPASFDQVARDLTLEAARLAGLGRITLIEEPLAAFYSWLIRHEEDWQDEVHPGELVLVCDVGGGTTDFTLISLRDADGRPRFERIAVGDHLILGGDNVDLSLARMLEHQVGGGRSSLDRDRWKTLCYQCRRVKEAVLEGTATRGKITLMGKGSKLIAGTITAELSREAVENAVLETFFPLVGPGDTGGEVDDGQVTEFGLPFAADSAVTRHLGRFLDRHRDDVSRILGREHPFPDHILFNGGSLKPPVVQDRIRQALRQWFGRSGSERPRVLENPVPDLAVSLGAAYYGMVKTGCGVRVGSGSARSFYLGIGRQGGEGQAMAICLVERGQEEGTGIRLSRDDFEVLANRPVGFDLFSSSFRSGDRCGDLVAVDDTLSSLPPLKTVIQYGKKGEERHVPVGIEGEYTEMGTLSLWCRSKISPHRWQLQFQLRGGQGNLDLAETAVLDAETVEAASRSLTGAFDTGLDGSGLEGLGKTLARLVGMPRNDWPLGLLRKLVDDLIDLRRVRRTSPAFEIRWLNLVGFCLRPGRGEGFDPRRIQQLWKVYTKGPVHGGHPQVCSEWWVLWRRLAAGFRPGQQRQFIQDLSGMLTTERAGRGKIPPQERIEIWMAVANMELLRPEDKVKWGRQLLSEIRPKKVRPQQLWSLSRMGARDLLYGSADRVIPPAEAARWCRRLLEMPWRNPLPVGAALAQMARKTNDRTRDLDHETLTAITRWMAPHEKLADRVELLHKVVPMEKGEAHTIFGESLPAGLVMKQQEKG
jgi:molecular chaperone DnaK (HSP70)